MIAPGAVVMAMICAWGPLSGLHINPAVTAAFAGRGVFPSGWVVPVAGTWDLDPAHTHIGFMARHLMVSKVRGHFEKFEGQIITAGDPPSRPPPRPWTWHR